MRTDTHTLLRIRDAQCLRADTPPPAWVAGSLDRAPWVVIRRAPAPDAALPVGVRGAQRHERFAAFLPHAEILERVTPRELARRRAWTDAPRRERIAALAVLEAVAAIMRAHALEARWGPAGSVGFELASGHPSAHEASDLDLVVQLDDFPATGLARSLLAALAALPVRTDVLLEMPAGAAVLAEYAQQPGSFVLRTVEGPRLWTPPQGGSR
jgi:phosphoribosyl-dephospho-CoA transferase